MTIQEPESTTQPASAKPPTPVQHLRACLDSAIWRADDLAGRGGIERGIAKKHVALAAQYDNDAMVARRDVEIWRRLLELAEAETANKRQAGEPPMVEARPAPVVRTQPYGPPMVHCNGCSKPIRPANADEQAAAQAGQGLLDVRRECPDCSLNAAERVETA